MKEKIDNWALSWLKIAILQGRYRKVKITYKMKKMLLTVYQTEICPIYMTHILLPKHKQPSAKWTKDLMRLFSKKYTDGNKNTLKRYATSLVVRGIPRLLKNDNKDIDESVGRKQSIYCWTNAKSGGINSLAVLTWLLKLPSMFPIFHS